MHDLLVVTAEVTVAAAEGDDLVKQLLSLLCDPVQSELTSSDLDLLSHCKALTTGSIAQ